MVLPKLYSRRSDGKLQEWSVEVDGPRYRVLSGIVDGSIVRSEWTVAEPKNVGRSNETTPEQQALAEARSAWQKKRDAEYRESPEDLDDTFFEVMLAKKFDDVHGKGKLKFPAYSQPKLDGMRMVDSPTGQWSRKGKPVVTAPHVREITDAIRADHPDLMLDGELYCHKMKEDFNAIMSMAKKLKPTAQDLEHNRRHLQYWVYDIPSLGHLKFGERWNALQSILMRYDLRGSIVIVPTLRVPSIQRADELFAEYLDDGFEGQMIRSHDVYQNGRSAALLKRKIFQDEEFVIAEVHEGVGNRAGMAGRVDLLLPDGRTFGTDPMGDAEHRRWLLTNRDAIRGKKGTVTFFAYTPDGIPRFGKLKAVRDYE